MFFISRRHEDTGRCMSRFLRCLCHTTTLWGGKKKLISEAKLKRVHDVYQYIFSHRESMCWVSIIYSLSTEVPSHSFFVPSFPAEAEVLWCSERRAKKSLFIRLQNKLLHIVCVHLRPAQAFLLTFSRTLESPVPAMLSETKFRGTFMCQILMFFMSQDTRTGDDPCLDRLRCLCHTASLCHYLGRCISLSPGGRELYNWRCNYIICLSIICHIVSESIAGTGIGYIIGAAII